MNSFFNLGNIPQSTLRMKEKEIRFVPDGGLCLSGSPTDIADTQSPDLLNFWFDGGSLTLRPGLRKKLEQSYGAVIDVYPRDGRRLLLKRITQNGAVIDERRGVYLLTAGALLTFDGGSVERVPTMLLYQGGTWVRQYDDIDFSSCFLLPAGNCGADSADGVTEAGTVTLTADGETVYLFGGGRFMTVSPTVVMQPGDYPYTYVGADILAGCRQFYVPTLYDGCTPDGDGRRLQSRNLVAPRVSQSFTTDGAAVLYRLCDQSLDDDTVTIRYTPPGGNAAVFTIYAGFTADTQSGMTATLSRKEGTVSFSPAPAAAARPCAENNLTVTWSKTVYTSPPVLGCRAGVWFGGDSGTGGGNRVFLSGSPDRPGAVYYSGANIPSYFAEDACLNVGDPSEPVTAFGRQYDILVVLKSNSVHAITAGGSAAGETFAVRQVHAGTGCDMPGSVQLVDNALVWGNSSGGLYTLLSTSVRDERAVRPLSASVNAALLPLGTQTLQCASSCDTGSCYLLFAGQEVFAWDYATAPYQPGKASAPAQRELAFYRWRLPRPLACPFQLDDALHLADDSGGIYLLDGGAADDDGEWFDARWQSKAFEFGAPAAGKQLLGLTVRLAAQSPAQVTVGCYDGDDEITLSRQISPPQTLCTLRPPALWRRAVTVSVRRAAGDLSRFGVTGVAVRAKIAAGEEIL